MDRSLDILGCSPYRDEILDYFRRPERNGSLSSSARQHYDICVECVAAVVADAINSAGETLLFENDCPENEELRQVFAEWGMHLPPAETQQK